MKVKEFDEYAYPRRKPWWILILVVAIVLFAVYKRNQGPERGEADRGEVAQHQGEDLGGRGTEAVGGEDARPVPVEARGDVKQLIADGDRFARDGLLLEARQSYLAAYAAAGTQAVRAGIEPKLGRVNVDLVMKPYAMPEKEDYSVRPGDSVARLAKRFGTTPQLIARSNNIDNPNIIKAGDRFRILKVPFTIHVSKTRNELLLTMDGRFFKRYTVGTGRYGKTPVGTFEIDEKIKNPDWWTSGRRVPYGDPDNILGTHWLSIRATGDTPDTSGYGLHGTWDNSSLGKASSAGCVRMRNEEVEELFVLVPLGTPVVIEE